MSLAIGGMTISGFILFCGAVYHGLGWMRILFGPAASAIAVRARFPDIEADDPTALAAELPDAAKVAPADIHHVLPVFILVWCLMVEELSPGLSAFWGTCALIFLVATQPPLIAFFRGDMRLVAPVASPRGTGCHGGALNPSHFRWTGPLGSSEYRVSRPGHRDG